MKTDRLPQKKYRNRLPSLPLFQLSGGTAEDRSRFLRRLMETLENRALVCGYLGRADVVTRFSILSLAKRCDIVLADADVKLPLETIKIHHGSESDEGDLYWGGGDAGQFEKMVGKVVATLDSLILRIPVWGCLLIGGRSSRMGRPKHLLRTASGTAWLEHTVDVLSPLLDGMVISGDGLLPGSMRPPIRLPDVPGVAGPLAGVLAAGRWQPMVSWLLVACDMPDVTSEAAQWLLSSRHSGCWGVVPRQAGAEHCEPLFAWYDFRAAQLFEEQMLNDNLRLGAVAAHPKVENPVIPDRLRCAWQNVNTPEQLKSLYR